MKLAALVALLLLGAFTAAASGRPPDFCVRHTTNPNCVTTTSTTTTASTTTTPPALTTDQYGIATGAPSYVVTYNGGRFAEYVGHARDIGATALRTDYSSGSGTNFQKLHDAAVAAGLQVVPIIIAKSSWTVSTAQATASDLVTRYPATRKVELGNEPNGAWSWGATPNPSAYAALVAAMAPILRAGLPGVVLVGPGLAQYGVTDSGHMMPEQYTQGLIDAGTDEWIDCWGYHPYNDWGWYTKMPQVRQVLANAGISEPFCLTETGHNTLEFSEAQQAAELTWRIADAKARADIADFFWYSLQDHNTATGTSREDHFGLFRTDWSVKPGADAFKTAVG